MVNKRYKPPNFFRRHFETAVEHYLVPRPFFVFKWERSGLKDVGPLNGRSYFFLEVLVLVQTHS